MPIMAGVHRTTGPRLEQARAVGWLGRQKPWEWWNKVWTVPHALKVRFAQGPDKHVVTWYGARSKARVAIRVALLFQVPYCPTVL